MVNGQCDLTHVQEQIKNLANNFYSGEIIIKSTVIPGTTESLLKEHPNLKISFVPEFLRQDYAFDDFVSKELPVFVGARCEESFVFVSELHKIFGQKSFQTEPTEAELVKYFSNVFNSTRIVFANIFFELCSKIGVNYQNVLDASVNLPNIQRDSYLRCSEDLRGYSGKCLPKDIAAFNNFAKSLGISSSLFDSVIKDNQNYVK